MRLLVTSFLLALLALPSYAQQNMTIVRDAEIESVLRRWSAPMWRQAGLNPNAVRVIMMQDDDLNAFTAGGQVMFVTTGLLMRAEDPSEILGVLAHETGHIAGGHVLLQKERAKSASYESIIGMVLGTGAGLLTGSGQVGSAIGMASQARALHGFLAHSRLEESAADQAAVTYLSKAGLPVRGLPRFFEEMENEELLPAAQQRAYARTHPITRDRIEALRARVETLPDPVTPPEERAMLKRIQAKLLAYTNPNRAAFQHKGDAPTDLMARAIVAYRQNKMSEALSLTDRWLKAEPENPYAYEFKGQILKDSGRPGEAVAFYEKALEKTKTPLIRVDAAHAMLESHNPALTDKAISYLNAALESEPQNSFAYRLLATAYGAKNMEPEAQIVLADMALRQNQTKRARELVAIAYPKLSAKSPVRRRATDLKLLLDSLPEAD